jgi:hypothetical protein
MDIIQTCANLPAHGRIACSLCHANKLVVFDETRTEQEQADWRITANPLAWGNPHAEILVLGFSKGPNALGALAKQPHDAIPYAGQRTWMKKILSRIGVLGSRPIKWLA